MAASLKYMKAVVLRRWKGETWQFDTKRIAEDQIKTIRKLRSYCFER